MIETQPTEHALRRALGEASNGRVACGAAVVLGSSMLLPTPVWLGLLVAVLATRPFQALRSIRGGSVRSQPALQGWIVVGVIFLAAAALSIVRKPVTMHGVQLLGWFSLVPAIGIAFWMAGRRSHFTTAIWVGTTTAACGAGVVAIIQCIVVGENRAEGLVENAITFGNLALLAGAVSLCTQRLIVSSGREVVWLSWAAGVLGLVASIMSGSRGGWLALPLILAILAWQVRSELNPLRLGVIALVVLSMASVSTVATGGMPIGRAFASVTNLFGYAHESHAPQAVNGRKKPAAGSSEGARLEAWKAAGEAFLEHPVTGIGWGNLGDRFDREAALGHRNERIATFEHAHNQLIGTAASSGVVGVTALLALFGFPLWEFIRAMRSERLRRRTLGAAGVMVLGSFAVFAQTEAILENLVPVAFLAVIVAALFADLDHEQSAADEDVDSGPGAAMHEDVLIDLDAGRPADPSAVGRDGPTRW